MLKTTTLFLFLTLSFCSYLHVNAQNDKDLDAQNSSSLKELKSKTDEEFDAEVERLLKTSKQFYGKNIDSALYYANSIITKSKARGSEFNVTKGRRIKGVLLALKGEYTTADSLLLSNLKRPIDSLTLGLNYQSLGNSYELQRKFDLAIEHYLKSVDVYNAIKSKVNLYRANVSIASLNARIGRYDYAIKYFESVIDYAKEHKINLSETVTNLAAIYLATKDYKTFLSKSNEAIAIAKKENNGIALGTLYNNLCEFYMNTEGYINTTKASNYCKLALKEKERYGALESRVYAQNSLANYYLNEGKYNMALQYLNKAYPHSKGNVRLSVLKNYIDVYRKKGKLPLALKYSDAYIAQQDSISKLKTSKKLTETVAEMTEKFESEKKQQEIDKLNIEKKLQNAQLNNQYYLFAAVMALIAILSIIIYYRYRNQKVKQQLSTQNLRHKLLQTQLNPHFLFHALNAIQSYIFQNKKNQACSYLVSYSKLMRNILESSEEDFTTVKDDSDAMKAFLKLQQLNVSEDAKLDIDIAADIDAYKIPPMFVQPFAENAIIHGINDIENGKVTVNYLQNDSSIIVKIIDNGTGFKANKSNNKMHRSMSSKILKERIELLKKRYNYTITYTTDTGKNGTTVSLYFPKLK